jgi:hypothetical protein
VNPPGAAQKTTVPALDRLRALRADHPVATAALAYGLVSIVAVFAAFYALFTQFGFYDDDGTLLVALQAFADGQVLYRDIYAAYGPFFFDVFGGLFALTGWAVTNDTGREIAVVVWIATSVVFGVAAQRLSGRLSLGVGGMVVAFSALGVLAAEPTHPQVLIAPLLAGIVLLVSFEPGRRARWLGAAIGALLACLVLTKVNVGAYAVGAMALAAILTWRPLWRWRWLRWVGIAGLLAAPFLITYPDLRQEWVRELAALELLSLGAIAIASRSARPSGDESEAAMGRWLLGALTGAFFATVLILGLLLLTGTTPSEAYEGIVGQALKLRESLMVPLEAPGAAVDWGIFAVLAAGLSLWLRRGHPGSPAWPGLLRVAAGLVIWFTVAGTAPFSIGPPGNFIALPMALAWVAALAPAGARELPYRRFVRVFLPLLAVTQTLQVYPVAGSQVRIASLAFVAVGAICLADGIGQLRSWSVARGWETLRFEVTGSAVALAIAAILGFHAVLSPAVSGMVTYSGRASLSLRGADLLRLEAPHGEELTELVHLLRKHRCTTFIGFPNVNSLYLFSEIEPPKPNAPGAWPILLSDAQQQRVVDQMRASPRPCAIRDDKLAETAWLHGMPMDEIGPLADYIFNEFETAKTVGEFEFQLPKSP